MTSITTRIERVLDPFLEQYFRLQRLPGLAIGVVQGRELVYARGLGVKSLNDGGEVTPETLFHMASITKPFVATALMQLVEAGRLDLDAPVQTYLPYFTLADPRASTLTTRQMLSHTSGMPDTDEYEWDRPQYDDGALERYVRGINELTLASEPGERFAYSNIAYEVLGDVIAKVSGQSFENYVTRHILAPLGMRQSVLAVREADQTLVARGHTWDSEGEIAPRDVYPYNRAHAPSSTLCSNVVDMSRWAAALLAGGELDGQRVLKQDTLESMWAPVTGSKPDFHEHVGLSWFMRPYRGRRTVQHSGGDVGFCSNLVLLPSETLAVVAMCNSDHIFGLGTLTNAALEALFGP
jgi:CubicO group peptidase (beta-lactamase class C family)